jgi:hypothetical protein
MTYENCPSCGTALGDGWCEACDAESDRLNRPEAGAVPKPSARDWTEDFGHENGNYESICWRCGDTFIGHKRRVACKVCASSATQDTDRLCTEIAETAGAIEATEERTPMPDVAGYAELLTRLLSLAADMDAATSDHSFPAHWLGTWHLSEEALVDSADALRTMPATILRYLYAEAGVRLNELGATEPLRIAYATLRKDIRKWAERFGVELGDG